MIAPVADSLGNLTLKISGETTFQNVIHSRQYRIELMKVGLRPFTCAGIL